MPSSYAGGMKRTTVWIVGIIALAAAAVLGQAGYGVYQKRVQQKEVAALVGDSTEKLRQALGAKVSPALVSALEANLQATKAPRLPELADAAEHYITGGRETPGRRAAAMELERRAAASRAALAGHMAHASRRNSGWLRD